MTDLKCLAHLYEDLSELSVAEREGRLTELPDSGVRELLAQLLRSGERAAASGFLVGTAR